MSLGTRSQQLGEYVSFPWRWNYGFAWSESTDRSEVQYFFDYLEKMGWLERNPLGPEIGQAGNWRVSVNGHSRVDELQREEHASASSQAFVAMWFHESTTKAFEKGIKPAIEDVGYEPLRIDRKEHINKIDDEIIAEIRRSRFLVADFTHGRGWGEGRRLLRGRVRPRAWHSGHLHLSAGCRLQSAFRHQSLQPHSVDYP